MLECSQSNSLQFNRLNIAGNYMQLNFQTIEKATGNQSRTDIPTDKFCYPEVSHRMYYNNLGLEKQKSVY